MNKNALFFFGALFVMVFLSFGTALATGHHLGERNLDSSDEDAIAASVTQEWVDHHPGLRGVGIAVGDNNFIYVTGPSPNDESRNFRRNIVTIKYDQAGNQIWVREWDETDDSTHGDDYSTWLALDPSGNVLVTGRSFLDGSGEDFITLKYDPNGNLLWKARTKQGYEAARVAADGAGNVYVTGRSSPNDGSSDYVTVKYGVNGNEQWVRTYNGPNDFADIPGALAASEAGDVVVTGTSTGGVSGYDAATIYYDTDGNERWVRRYTSDLDNKGDAGNGVAFGLSGEIYVGGTTNPGDYIDFLLIRYDQEGNEVWIRTFDGTAHRGDSIRRVGVDSQGNIIVTGYGSDAELSTVYLTVKYDPDGNLLWQRIFEGPVRGEAYAYGLAIGPDDAVYVTGDAVNDIGTVAYDANGNELWSATYDNGFDRGYNVALDSDNNVYVVGQEPIITIRYTQSGGVDPTATPTATSDATATPTNTASPTPTATTAPTDTPTPASNSMHVGDLDGSSRSRGALCKNGPAAAQSRAGRRPGRCPTASAGDNHDPDGDSDGSSITVARP